MEVYWILIQLSYFGTNEDIAAILGLTKNLQEDHYSLEKPLIKIIDENLQRLAVDNIQD
jgi:hypothetical protein